MARALQHDELWQPDAAEARRPIPIAAYLQRQVWCQSIIQRASVSAATGREVYLLLEDRRHLALTWEAHTQLTGRPYGNVVVAARGAQHLRSEHGPVPITDGALFREAMYTMVDPREWRFIPVGVFDVALFGWLPMPERSLATRPC